MSRRIAAALLLAGSPLAAAPPIANSECAGALDPAHEEATRHWFNGAMADDNAGRIAPPSVVFHELTRLCEGQPGLDIARAGSEAHLLVAAHRSVRSLD